VLNAIPATAGSVSTSYLVDGSVTQAKLSTNVVGNGPAFSVAVGSQTISNSTTTTIQFTTVTFDTASCYNTSTYRFTPNVAGYYWFSFTSSGNNLLTGETFAYILKNTSGSIIYDIQASGVWSQSGSLMYYANGTTDYFSVQLYQSSGSSKTLDSGTRFYGYLARTA
jgi:hypothetical protein